MMRLQTHEGNFGWRKQRQEHKQLCARRWQQPGKSLDRRATGENASNGKARRQLGAGEVLGGRPRFAERGGTH
jgi:hypothetical protein